MISGRGLCVVCGASLDAFGGCRNGCDDKRRRVINLELHWPPSVNRWWRPAAGRPGLALTKPARKYKADAQLLIRAQLGPGFVPFTDEVCIRMMVCPPTSNADIDNINKAVLDSLEAAGVLENDKLVTRLEMDKVLPAKRPGYVRLVIFGRADCAISEVQKELAGL